jgi:hypothetical protein
VRGVIKPLKNDGGIEQLQRRIDGREEYNDELGHTAGYDIFSRQEKKILVFLMNENR